MGMSDWNDKIGTAAMFLSTDYAHTGNKSLKVDNSVTAPAIKILDQSEVDQPGNVNIITQLLLKFPSFTDGKYYVGFFVRYTDLNNYFRLSLRCSKVSYPTGTIGVYLERIETGNNASILLKSMSGSYFESWHKWEVRFCTISGSLYAEVYFDDVSQGETNLAESNQTNGGVGIGNIWKDARSYFDHYFDQTCIYY